MITNSYGHGTCYEPVIVTAQTSTSGPKIQNIQWMQTKTRRAANPTAEGINILH